ncbi:MAG: SDR family NAD(P)-dependent oxidoreductase [Chlorobi bacterium]|nr:SDR family NAD(P)-dependent oxidoreductase [Chlorobiota bacterium]
MKFENKTILITGASTGIGKAISRKLLQRSCNLVLIARRDFLIMDYINETENITAKVKIVKCDVSKKNEVENAYNEAISEFDNIDIAVLNSGVGFHVTPSTFNSKYAEETININFLGVVYWIEQILPEMMKRKGGIIAPVSSLADNRGYSGSGFYCASKAALSIFLEGLSIDLKKFGIKIITIKPGFVKTPMTDKNKFKMPFIIPVEKSADYIITGIEKEKSIIQFPLPTVIGAKIIGLLPNWLYKLLAKSGF